MVKIALAFWGITRSLKYTYTSLEKHIFNILKNNNIEYKIFLHTYYVNNIYNNIRGTEINIKLDNDEYKLLNPDYLQIDDEDVVKDALNFNQYRTFEDPWKTNYNCVDHFIYAIYSKTQVVKMIKNSNIDFDYILFLRPDVKYLNDFNINFFNLMNSTTILVPLFHMYNNINDRFAVCSSKNYEIYGDLFDKLLPYSKIKCLHAETFYFDILKEYNIDVIHIPFYFNRIRSNKTEINDVIDTTSKECDYNKLNKKCSCCKSWLSF